MNWDSVKLKSVNFLYLNDLEANCNTIKFLCYSYGIYCMYAHNACTHTHIHTHTYTHTHTHTHTNTHTYTHAYTHIHTNIHTDTHTYTHAYTHIVGGALY